MPTIDIPADAQDVLRWVRAGYNNPPDRTPGSQSLAQMAFAVGRNFKVRGYICPYEAVAWDDPILGTFFICRTRFDTAFLLQPWPHPQTGGKYLITATVERVIQTPYPGSDPGMPGGNNE
jgi:hypothetical protein